MPRIINIEASDSAFISGKISGVGSLLAAIPHHEVDISGSIVTGCPDFPW